MNLFILLLLLFAQSDSLASQQPYFTFHNNFFLNLHHFLYQQAKESSADWMQDLPEEQTAIWKDALAYYKANVISRDLLFDEKMRLIDAQLTGIQKQEELANLKIDQAWIEILQNVTPVYKHWWQEHAQKNQEWLLQTKQLLEHESPKLTEKLTSLYEHSWPKEPIRVDLLCYANWAGAYTSYELNHIRISADDSKVKSPHEKLEVLFHEAGHLLIDNLSNSIIEESKKLGMPPPKDLWHAIIFYTTGEVMKTLESTPTDFRPYAERLGLYDRSTHWKNYYQALQKYWQPYLQGEVTARDAIAKLLTDLNSKS